MSSEIHSVYFLQAEGWTPEKARSWLKGHDIKPSKRMRHEGDQLRYNVIPKEMFTRFTTKKTSDNVYIVFGWHDKKKGQRGGSSGLVGYWNALQPELKATNWLSQTASNMGQLPMTPALAQALSVVASQGLRHAGY
jgi:hypothetical protein